MRFSLYTEVSQLDYCVLQGNLKGGPVVAAILPSRMEVRCWFQTNLPLAALPLRRVIIACCFRVAVLSSGNAALAFHRAAIAPELNRIQLSAICRGGQSGKVIDLLAWRCLPLGHPSAASGACAVELISSSKRQCGKRQVSLKPALLYLRILL